MNWDQPMRGVPLLLVVGAGLGLAYNASHEDPLPWIARARAVVKLEELNPASPSGEEAALAATGPDGGPAADPAPADPGESPSADPGSPAPEVPAGAGSDPPTAVEEASPEAPDGPSDAAIESLLAALPESEFPISVPLARAKEIYDSGRSIILDARSADEYIEGHVRGAEAAPYDAVGSDPDWLDRTAARAPILLVYCGGGDCELSLDLAFALTQAGHRRVIVFEEGYTAWTRAGYPIMRGELP